METTGSRVGWLPISKFTGGQIQTIQDPYYQEMVEMRRISKLDGTVSAEPIILKFEH